MFEQQYTIVLDDRRAISRKNRDGLETIFAGGECRQRFRMQRVECLVTRAHIRWVRHNDAITFCKLPIKLKHCMRTSTDLFARLRSEITKRIYRQVWKQLGDRDAAAHLLARSEQGLRQMITSCANINGFLTAELTYLVEHLAESDRRRFATEFEHLEKHFRSDDYCSEVVEAITADLSTLRDFHALIDADIGLSWRKALGTNHIDLSC